MAFLVDKTLEIAYDFAREKFGELINKIQSGKPLTSEEANFLLLFMVLNEVRLRYDELAKQIQLNREMIKETEGRLDKKIDSCEKRLRDDIKATEERLDKKIELVRDELNKRIDDLRLDLTKRIDDTNKRLDSLEHRVYELEKDVEELKVAVARLDNKVDLLVDDMKELKKMMGQMLLYMAGIKVEKEK
ncbi:hypothetical protein IPA_08320 [Ignicoccus pacificus DSM 13166]|uniref:Uncharacterized protein n=1 Tax=Ignicoccus pacificus DSM 13166 TaxID=940294 RepID=A0A977KCP5_9CREN|nr:hypothetical protein IPA_08320 [Ignicoccus pacificus DSM 13166]